MDKRRINLCAGTLEEEWHKAPVPAAFALIRAPDLRLWLHALRRLAIVSEFYAIAESQRDLLAYSNTHRVRATNLLTAPAAGRIENNNISQSLSLGTLAGQPTPGLNFKLL